MKVFVIGHVDHGRTTLTLSHSHDMVNTNTTDITPTDQRTDYYGLERYYGREITITNNYCEPYTYTDYERFSRIAELKEIREGWLKPHKQLRPFNHNILNFNLPRSRLREKKELFNAA